MKFENLCGMQECSILKAIKKQRFDEYDQIKKKKSNFQDHQK